MSESPDPEEEEFTPLGADVTRRSHGVALFLAGVGSFGGGALSYRAADLVDRLKELWPEVEIDPGLPAFGAIMALLAGIAFAIYPKRVLAEILHTLRRCCSWRRRSRSVFRRHSAYT